MHICDHPQVSINQYKGADLYIGPRDGVLEAMASPARAGRLLCGASLFSCLCRRGAMLALHVLDQSRGAARASATLPSLCRPLYGGVSERVISQNDSGHESESESAIGGSWAELADSTCTCSAAPRGCAWVCCELVKLESRAFEMGRF